MDQMEWRSWACTSTGRLALLLLFVQNHLRLAQIELATLLPPLAEMPPSLSMAVDLKAMKRNILALKDLFTWNSYLTWGRGQFVWASENLIIFWNYVWILACIRTCVCFSRERIQSLYQVLWGVWRSKTRWELLVINTSPDAYHFSSTLLHCSFKSSKQPRVLVRYHGNFTDARTQIKDLISF